MGDLDNDGLLNLEEFQNLTFKTCGRECNKEDFEAMKRYHPFDPKKGLSILGLRVIYKVAEGDVFRDFGKFTTKAETGGTVLKLCLTNGMEVRCKIQWKYEKYIVKPGDIGEIINEVPDEEGEVVVLWKLQGKQAYIKANAIVPTGQLTPDMLEKQRQKITAIFSESHGSFQTFPELPGEDTATPSEIVTTKVVGTSTSEIPGMEDYFRRYTPHQEFPDLPAEPVDPENRRLAIVSSNTNLLAPIAIVFLVLIGYLLHRLLRRKQLRGTPESLREICVERPASERHDLEKPVLSLLV